MQQENQQIFLPVLKKLQIELWIKREDKIHQYVSGNKFRKLKYNILKAKEEQKNTLLTFGGAFSNHIVATAVAGNLSNFKTIGIIRGEELAEKMPELLKLNKSLYIADKNKMKFEFVSRQIHKNKNTAGFIQSLKKKFGNFYLIPEGGTNSLGIKGCEEILLGEDKKFDYICVAVGTGGTISGIINTIRNHQKVIGFQVLKGDFLNGKIKRLTENLNWSLQTQYHFGGYGKYTPDLIEFINKFKTATGVLSDPIYTGKMLYGIINMIKTNKFEKGSKILAIHTGGIQGIDGVNKKLQKKNMDLIHI